MTNIKYETHSREICYITITITIFIIIIIMFINHLHCDTVTNIFGPIEKSEEGVNFWELWFSFSRILPPLWWGVAVGVRWQLPKLCEWLARQVGTATWRPGHWHREHTGRSLNLIISTWQTGVYGTCHLPPGTCHLAPRPLTLRHWEKLAEMSPLGGLGYWVGTWYLLLASWPLPQRLGDASTWSMA